MGVLLNLTQKWTQNIYCRKREGGRDLPGKGDGQENGEPDWVGTGIWRAVENRNYQGLPGWHLYGISEPWHLEEAEVVGAEVEEAAEEEEEEEDPESLCW